MFFLNFDELVFIMAASFMTLFLHAAGAAFFCKRTVHIPAYQLVHAVMQLNGRPGRGDEVDE